MSRTTLYKGVYFAMMGAALLMVAGVAWWFRWGLAGLFVLPILLVPGRVLGFFWRDLLTGLRLLNARDFVNSKRHSERFLVQVRAKPWLKRLIWLGSSSYSRDPEAMALNNLGAAELALGEIDAARRHLEEAIGVDRRNPLPFYNLGLLHRTIEDADMAERCFAEARRLGYTRGWSDGIVTTSQTRFAARDG